MERRFSDSRGFWVSVGLVAGLCLSYFWPHEPALAVATASSERFAIATCPVALDETVEAVFVLDYLTGRLQGAVLNPQTRRFTQSYMRNVAQDFQIGANATPQWAMVTGRSNLVAQGPVQMSNSCIYIAELTTGRVQAYGFPYRVAPRPVPPTQLIPIDTFQFRQPAVTN